MCKLTTCLPWLWYLFKILEWLRLGICEMCEINTVFCEGAFQLQALHYKLKLIVVLSLKCNQSANCVNYELYTIAMCKMKNSFDVIMPNSVNMSLQKPLICCTHYTLPGASMHRHQQQWTMSTPWGHNTMAYSLIFQNPKTNRHDEGMKKELNGMQICRGPSMNWNGMCLN